MLEAILSIECWIVDITRTSDNWMYMGAYYNNPGYVTFKIMSPDYDIGVYHTLSLADLSKDVVDISGRAHAQVCAVISIDSKLRYAHNMPELWQDGFTRSEEMRTYGLERL